MKLCLLDAYALIYRAYYALINSPRINSRKENTSAVYGFVNTLEEVLRKEKPDFIGIAFDPSGPTFRHEAYPEYKAQREATPEDIRFAVPFIKDIIRAYGIALLEVPGFEADDVIGTVAKKAVKSGVFVQMITPDKDYAQLVEPGIVMCKPGRGSAPFEILDEKAVCEKYGLENTTQVIDYLGLMGDASDNVPGCPGVGPKTASQLLRQFGSIEHMLDHTDEIKGALRKKVEDNAEQIRFSKFLVTIKTDVPLQVELDNLRMGEPNREKLTSIFERLEFRSFIQRFEKGEDNPAAAKPKTANTPPPQMGDLFASVESQEPTMGDLFATETKNVSTETFFGAKFPPEGPSEAEKTILSDLNSTPHEYTLVENEEDMRKICAKFLEEKIVSLDTETTSTDAMTAELVGLSFCAEPGKAFYVSVPANEEAARRIVGIFSPLYEHPSILKVGQNLKYDLTVLSRYGATLSGPMFDTMLAHYLVQPELRHNMDFLAEIYLHYRTIHIDQLIGPAGKNQLTMRQVSPTLVCDYAAEDADVTLRLMKPLEAEMEKYGVRRVFDEIEMPLMPVLARMEMNGVRLDTTALAETNQLFNERMKRLEGEIYNLAGHEFLLTSPRQVGEVLFGEMHLSDKAKKTKSGQYQTSEAVLESLKTKHPIVEKILAHRALKKLISTYLEALPKLVNPHTGRIHTSFNQAVTATGRLSSSNPNLQNIPVRGEDGREIRKAFIPEEGCTFFSADYSQIELRLMAHLSGDRNMIEAFRHGADVHAATAAKIFKKPLADITKDERRKAKTANFGIIYGISAFGLAERMEVSRTEARELIDNYFETFPGVRNYMTQSVDRARDMGYIETQFGRRRYLPDINSHNSIVRGYAERNAVNAPIQGTAADIIKIAMIRIDERLRREQLKAKMILQVHDELNFSVPLNELERVRKIVIEEMEGAYPMSVPLVADCGHGANWLEAH